MSYTPFNVASLGKPVLQMLGPLPPLPTALLNSVLFMPATTYSLPTLVLYCILYCIVLFYSNSKN